MQDPVCGMTVEPETAAGAWEHDEQVYLFCSVGCLERFKEDPRGFLEMDPSQRGMGEPLGGIPAGAGEETS